MKGFRKKLAGLLVFAMVLGILTPGMTTTVKAADAPQIVSEVNLLDETITLKSTSAAAIKYLALKDTEVKVNADHVSLSKTEKDLKLKATDWETAESELIDISWASKTKASAILFKAVDKDDKVLSYTIVKLNAQDKNFKVGFVSAQDKPADDAAKELGSNKDKVMVSGSAVVGDPDLGYFYFYTKDEKGNNVSVAPRLVNWKKGTSSSWKAVKDSSGSTPITDLSRNLQLFKAKGASISFRYASNVVIQSTGDWFNVSANWPSKEVKYSFKKQAAAPKVTIDYVKGTVNLKAGQEYMLEGVTADSADWINVEKMYGTPDSKGKYKVPTLLLSDLYSQANASGEAITTTKLTKDDIYSGTLVLKVRTAATSKAIPSKIATVQLKEENLSATSASIKATLATDASPASITVGYKVKTDANSGLVVTRTDTTGDAYEFAYVVSGGTIDAKTKWTKLPVAKAANKPTVVAVKLAKDEKIATSSSIFIRIAGTKASKDKAGKLYSPNTEVKLANLKKLDKKLTAGEATVPASNASVSCKNGAVIANEGKITVNVLKSAVSEAAVKVKIPFAITNATSKTAKVAKSGATGANVTFTVPTALADEKMEITVEVKKGDTAGGSILITVDSDVKFTIDVKVVDALQ